MDTDMSMNFPLIAPAQQEQLMRLRRRMLGGGGLSSLTTLMAGGDRSSGIGAALVPGNYTLADGSGNYLAQSGDNYVTEG